MSNQEITVVEYELEASGGNLRTLQSGWNDMPAIQDLLEESAGLAAEKARDAVDCAHQARQALSQLLDKSIAFFERVGLTFQEADQNAAANADKLTL